MIWSIAVAVVGRLGVVCAYLDLRTCTRQNIRIYSTECDYDNVVDQTERDGVMEVVKRPYEYLLWTAEMNFGLVCPQSCRFFVSSWLVLWFRRGVERTRTGVGLLFVLLSMVISISDWPTCDCDWVN